MIATLASITLTSIVAHSVRAELELSNCSSRPVTGGDQQRKIWTGGFT